MSKVNVYNKQSGELEYIDEDAALENPDKYHIDPDLTALEAVDLDPRTYKGELFNNEFHLVDGALVLKNEQDPAERESAYIAEVLLPQAIRSVDAITSQNIAEGTFTHANLEFSMTLTAQIKWIGLLNAKDITTYPQTVYTKDNSATYSIADADEVVTMYAGIFAAVKAIVDAGNVAKAVVATATTVASLNSLISDYANPA